MKGTGLYLAKRRMFSLHPLFAIYKPDPSHSCKPLAKTVVDHSLKQSLETQKHNFQNERTQIFTASGGEGAITFLLSLLGDNWTKHAHRKPTRWG